MFEEINSRALRAIPSLPPSAAVSFSLLFSSWLEGLTQRGEEENKSQL